MSAFQSWIKQKTTILGISAVLGVASALLGGTMDWAHAMPVLVGAASAMIFPEHVAVPST